MNPLLQVIIQFDSCSINTYLQLNGDLDAKKYCCKVQTVLSVLIWNFKYSLLIGVEMNSYSVCSQNVLKNLYPRSLVNVLHASFQITSQ